MFHSRFLIELELQLDRVQQIKIMLRELYNFMWFDHNETYKEHK